MGRNLEVSLKILRIPVTISMFIVLFTSGPHLRHNYHGNKTLETMLSGFVESSDID